MPGQYKFTGNPKIAMYKPRGLQYFSYLPQLKAKVRGAALAKADKMQFDTSGVAPMDLQKVQEMTKQVDTDRDALVDDLLGDDAVHSGVVDKLYKLARNKREKDQKIGASMKNAELRQKFRDETRRAALTTGRYEYYNRVDSVADEQFGSTFDPNTGEVKEWNPKIPAGYYDLRKDLDARLALAKENMTPEQIARYDNADFQMIKMPDGSYKIDYGKAMTEFENSDPLKRAVDGFNAMISNKEGDAGKYINMMEGDPNFVLGFNKSFVNNIKDNYLRTDYKDMTDLYTPPGQYTNKTDAAGNLVDAMTYIPELNESNPNEIILSGTEKLSNTETAGLYEGTYTPGNLAENRPTTYTVKPIENQNEYIADTQAFLFGEAPLSINQLNVLLSTDPTQKRVVDGKVVQHEDRYKNNRLAQGGRDFMKNSKHPMETTAYTNAVTELEELLLEEDENFNADTELDLTLSTEPSQKAIDARKKKLIQEKGNLSGGEPMSDITDELLSPIDKAKQKVLSAAINLHNIVADTDRGKDAYSEFTVPFLSISKDATGSQVTKDAYDKGVKPEIQQSFNEGAHGLVLEYDPDSKTTKSIYSSQDKNTAENRELVSASIQLKDADKETENLGHPTMLATDASDLVGPGFFGKGTPDELAKKKKEFNKVYENAWVYKRVQEIDGKKKQIYTLVQNTLDDRRFGNIKRGLLGLDGAGNVVRVKDVIDDLPRGRKTRVAITPEMEFEYSYQDGGNILKRVYVNGQEVEEKFAKYITKNQAKKNLFGIQRQLQQSKQSK